MKVGAKKKKKAPEDSRRGRKRYSVTCKNLRISKLRGKMMQTTQWGCLHMRSSWELWLSVVLCRRAVTKTKKMVPLREFQIILPKMLFNIGPIAEDKLTAQFKFPAIFYRCCFSRRAISFSLKAASQRRLLRSPRSAASIFICSLL